MHTNMHTFFFFERPKGDYELGGLTALGSSFDANADNYVKEEASVDHKNKIKYNSTSPLSFAISNSLTPYHS